MFVANTNHSEGFLINWEGLLSPKKMERLKNTSGYIFYKLIFSKVEEADFAVLYSRHPQSAPNSPVNRLVSALFLLHKYNWSVDELMRQIDFNIEVQVALGLKTLEEHAFSRRTLFNFKNRLLKHQEKTGENLLETVFDKLTSSQLKELSVKTNIQRGDTVLINTNIRVSTRLSLLVEVLSRVYRILSQSDQELYGALFGSYIEGGEKWVYKLTGENREEQKQALAKAYYSVQNLFGAKYGEHPVFQVFERVKSEHFKQVKPQEVEIEEVKQGQEVAIKAATAIDLPTLPIVMRPSTELGSDTIQSPDDTEATYRTKRGVGYQGFSLFGMETCHPDNEVDLVTKVVTVTNKTDDATILEENLEEMVAATPDLEEGHFDGGFGSTQVDKIADKQEVVIIQTAVKGRTASAPIKVSGNEEIGFEANCSNPAHPPVKASSTGKSYKAEFDRVNHCEGCPFYDQCPTKRERNKKGKAVFRFNKEEALKQERHRAIDKIPKERRGLRSGVENLMGLMHRGEKHTGKLKVRGLFNFELYGFAMGVVINFERIFRYLSTKNNCFLTFWNFLASWSPTFPKSGGFEKQIIIY